MTSSKVGDGATTEIKIENVGLHPTQAMVGPENALQLAVSLDGYTTASVHVQCADGSVGPAPELNILTEGQQETVKVSPVAFETGPPTLWISSATAGRAQLAALLKPQGHRVIHQGLEELPQHFAALRFAPWMLIELADLVALTPQRRRALRRAVASGSMLVIAVGEGADETGVMQDFIEGALTPARRPGPALKGALPQAAGHRPVSPEGQGQVLLTADGSPLVTEWFLGLGRVRVVGVRLKALTEGPVTDVLFERPPAPLAHVLSWLSARPPVDGRPAGAFAWWIWAVLLGLVVSALLALRMPRAGVATALACWIGACVLPPQGASIAVTQAEALMIPVGDEALSVGVVDLSVAVGGGFSLPGAEQASLEEARPVGACLTLAAEEGHWMLTAEPGDRRRLVYFAFTAETTAEVAGEQEAFPEWPAGALAGATRSPIGLGAAHLPLGDVVVDMQSAELSGWWVEPAPRRAVTPEALIVPQVEDPG
ncbi:MAG: hypothetical protein ACE366_27790 [Bradymonadia bacterium]